MIVACTGPTDPKHGIGTARALVHTALATLDERRLDGEAVSEFRTGAAFGIDSLCFYAALPIFPSTKHHVFVPQGCRYNQDLVGFAKQEQHRVTGVPGGYLKRDDALVEGADLLLAFPETMNEVLRSGTWSTIRRAWKRDVPVRYYPLDGKPGPVVRCT